MAKIQQNTKPRGYSELLRKISLSAMFLALAVATKMLSSFSIPVLGANGIKVGFGGIFTAFPAFLFGPLYGGAVCALSDVLGYLIKPDGAYIPWLTLTAFLAGFLKGLVWMIVKNKKNTALKIIVAVFLAFTLFTGIFSYLSLAQDNIGGKIVTVAADLPSLAQANELKETGSLSFVSKAIVSLAQYSIEKSFPKNLALYINLLTGGLTLFSILGFLVLAIESFASKLFSAKRLLKKNSENSTPANENDGSFFKIFLSVFTAGIITTTINTEILRNVLGAWSGRAFFILWVPRAIEEVLICIIQSYIIAILYEVYMKKIKPSFHISR